MKSQKRCIMKKQAQEWRKPREWENNLSNYSSDGISKMYDSCKSYKPKSYNDRNSFLKEEIQIFSKYL